MGEREGRGRERERERERQRERERERGVSGEKKRLMRVVTDFIPSIGGFHTFQE